MLWMGFFERRIHGQRAIVIRNRFAGCSELFIHPASEAGFRETTAGGRGPHPASAGG